MGYRAQKVLRVIVVDGYDQKTLFKGENFQTIKYTIKILSKTSFKKIEVDIEGEREVERVTMGSGLENVSWFHCTSHGTMCSHTERASKLFPE